MPILLQLFFAFIQVGLFSVGGGYAAIPLIQNQIVDVHHLMTLGEFTDLITIAEMTPGPISINSATFVGTRLAGIPGSILCTLGCIIPSFCICLALAHFYYKYRNFSGVQTVLSALRPAVVALIAAPTFSMAKSAKVNRYTIWIPVVSALLIWLLGFSPIWIIIAAGVGGFCWGKWKQSHR